jgi:PhnB protein
MVALYYNNHNNYFVPIRYIMWQRHYLCLRREEDIKLIHVIPNLHFKGNCGQAIELYKKAYGAEVKTLLRYSEANPHDFILDDESQGNLVYHSEITIGTNRLMLNDYFTTDDDYQVGNSLSLLIHFDTVDELKTAYETMSDGAIIISPMESQTYCACFVSLIDKYGVQWELMAG